MTRTRTLRLVGAAALLIGFLVTGTRGASADPEPRAAKTPTTCVDGLGEAHVKLFAADGSDTSFTTVVSDSGGEVFRDDDRSVAAGQSETVAIPDLFHGTYSLQVLVDDEQILGDTIWVQCVPTEPYTNPSLGGGYGCQNETSYFISNDPIKGAEELLQPVHFVIAAHSKHGIKVLLDTTLPDNAGDPYSASVIVYPGDIAKGAKIIVTADGEPLQPGAFSIPSCTSDPYPPPPVPRTGG